MPGVSILHTSSSCFSTHFSNSSLILTCAIQPGPGYSHHAFRCSICQSWQIRSCNISWELTASSADLSRITDYPFCEEWVVDSIGGQPWIGTLRNSWQPVRFVPKVKLSTRCWQDFYIPYLSQGKLCPTLTWTLLIGLLTCKGDIVILTAVGHFSRESQTSG